MFRGLVEDVDALAENFIHLAGQQIFNAAQRLDAGGVNVVDFQRFDVTGHDIGRHGIEHLPESKRVFFGDDSAVLGICAVELYYLCRVLFEVKHETLHRFSLRGRSGDVVLDP